MNLINYHKMLIINYLNHNLILFNFQLLNILSLGNNDIIIINNNNKYKIIIKILITWWLRRIKSIT